MTIKRIKCFFGKHEPSPFVEIEMYNMVYKRCRVCGKLLATDKPCRFSKPKVLN